MRRASWFSIAALATLLLAGSALSVSADDRDSYRRVRSYRYSEGEVRQIGRRNGYELGLREGRRDRRQGFRFDYKHSRAYRDGKIGYHDEYRHDGNYKNGFREGFEAGYREAYNDDDRRNRPSDDRRYERDERPRFPRF